VDFPDPFVLRDGTTYYAFATNGGGKNVPVARSSDLATWSELADALPVLPAWAAANASLTWAPSVLRRGSTFVLYFTARSKAAGFQCIGRAVATQPGGPYVDDSAEPFVCQVAAPQALCGSIDASPFVAPNGDPYLLWKSDENASACAGDARLWTQRMGVDGVSLLGVPIELLKRDRSWEAPLVEGPSMFAAGNVYYLFYSANWWESSNYGIGYAVCNTPYGPCSKEDTRRTAREVRGRGARTGRTGDLLRRAGQAVDGLSRVVGAHRRLLERRAPVPAHRSTPAGGWRSVARRPHHDCEATVNARSFMADDAERIDPKGTMETVPPPKGAKDAYSAQTRIATLPEHVLEAMRAHETDASLEKRTKSGMRAAAVAAPSPPLAPPPLPSFASEADIAIPIIDIRSPRSRWSPQLPAAIAAWCSCARAPSSPPSRSSARWPPPS